MKQFEVGAMYFVKDEYYVGKIFRYTDINELKEVTENDLQLVIRNPQIEDCIFMYRQAELGKNNILNLHYDSNNPDI